LERISPERPSGEETNWHSAAEIVGFGTPGYKNSQFDDGKADSEISIDPEVFTPNNDGIDDYLNIRYKFDEAGYVANVYVYSSSGKFVRRLANNVTIGTEGAFSWDGKDENNQLSNAGIYIIVVEIFNLQGKTKQYKKTGTLGVRF
jgi:flagellar hook assembly protein FlgD